MMIDGRPTMAGTVMIRHGEMLNIDTPNGPASLRINDTGGDPKALFVDGVFILDGYADPAGTALIMAIKPFDGRQFEARFRVVADFNSPVHTVHYTFVEGA